MKTIKLRAYPRALTGRTGAKKVRSSGRVPAVIYGANRQSRPIEVVLKEWINALRNAGTENVLVELTIEGDEVPVRLAFVREVQHHPLSGQLLHLDFNEVDPNEKLTVMVPVETVGEAIGVKSGGILEHVLHRVRIRALPRDIPEAIVVDVSQLNIGQVIHIGDIIPPPGVEILGDKSLPVIAVTLPRVEEEAAGVPTAAPAPGEVEMIKEKKPEAAKQEEKAAAEEKKPKESEKPAKEAEKKEKK